MKSQTFLSLCIACSAALFITGCGSTAISPADRDTTGTYDGVWIGQVDKPRSSTEILPGNWVMNCDWEPFEIYMLVDDGRVQLGRLEQRDIVSTKGDFRIKLDSGGAEMVGGVMAGNGKFIETFAGNLSGDKPSGKYLQVVSSIGGQGCSAKIKFKREANSNAS